MASPLQGKRALVTGASSGLGVDFAKILAAKGCHVVLVARRADLLEQLAAELRATYGVEATAIAMDLGTEDAPQALYDRVRELGHPVDVLVNNAGYGLHGDFVDLEWERERNMLQLDILTLVHLTKLFARDMAARGTGWILQVSSVGAYQAAPTYASYAAAKSFVLSFGEALHEELKPKGVTVTVLSPGVTATEFLQVAGQQPTAYQRMVMMQSPDVARAGIEAMLAGKSSVLPGFLNQLSVFSIRFMPRALAAVVAHRLMKP